MRRKKKNHVILFLDLQNFSSLLTLLHPYFNTKWWWLGTKQMFSLAYYQEVMACVQDTALCTCSIHLQGKNPSVMPLTCSGSRGLPDLMCRSSQSSGMLWDARSSRPHMYLLNESTNAIALLFPESQCVQTSNSAVALLSFLSLWVSWVSGFFSLPCLCLLALTGFPVREFGLLSLVVPLWPHRSAYRRPWVAGPWVLPGAGEAVLSVLSCLRD